MAVEKDKCPQCGMHRNGEEYCRNCGEKMKIIYEFTMDEEEDDSNSHKLFKIAPNMRDSLMQISEYLNCIRKGFKAPTLEEMEEAISSMVYESMIHELD